MKYNDVTHVRGRSSKENKFKNKALGGGMGGDEVNGGEKRRIE